MDYYIYTDWLFQMSNQFQIQYYLEWQLSLRRNNINQAFILFNYCTLYINFSVFNDCLLALTVMFSMMVYFRGLLYLHWLTISNEYPVSNPILLRMTALFTKKAYKPSVSSFQLLYCVYQLQCFQWLPPYIDCNVLNDGLLLRTTIFTLTDHFKWVSCFKSNIVKNDSSLYWDKVIKQAFLLFN